MSIRSNNITASLESLTQSCSVSVGGEVRDGLVIRLTTRRPQHQFYNCSWQTEALRQHTRTFNNLRITIDSTTRFTGALPRKLNLPKVDLTDMAMRRNLGFSTLVRRLSSSVHHQQVDVSRRSTPAISRRQALTELNQNNAILPLSQFLTDTHGRFHDYLRISISERWDLSDTER